MKRRWLVGTPGYLRWRYLWLAVLLLVAWPAVSWSHAHPDQRSPAPGAVLQQAPGKVTIHYTEDLEPAFSFIKVTGPEGHLVDREKSHVDKDNARRMTVPLKPAANGTYTVHWHAVARDGHTTEGQYQFKVAAGSE